MLETSYAPTASSGDHRSSSFHVYWREKVTSSLAHTEGGFAAEGSLLIFPGWECEKNIFLPELFREHILIMESLRVAPVFVE